MGSVEQNSAGNESRQQRDIFPGKREAPSFAPGAVASVSETGAPWDRTGQLLPACGTLSLAVSPQRTLLVDARSACTACCCGDSDEQGCSAVMHGAVPTARTPGRQRGAPWRQDLGDPLHRPRLPFSYLLSAHVHVPHGNPTIRGTGHELPRELKVAQRLHPVTADTQHVSVCTNLLVEAPPPASQPWLVHHCLSGDNTGSSASHLPFDSLLYGVTVSTKQT